MRELSKRQSVVTRIRHSCAAPVLLMLAACFSFLVLPALHVVLHEREASQGMLDLRWRPTGAAWLPGEIDAAKHAEVSPHHAHSHPHPPVHLARGGLHPDPDARSGADSPLPSGAKRHQHGGSKDPADHGQGAVEHLGCALLESSSFLFVATYLPLTTSELLRVAEQVRSPVQPRRHGSRAPPRDSFSTIPSPSMI